MNWDHFRNSPRPTLGVELEFQVVDPATLSLTDAAAEVLAGVTGPTTNRGKSEFHACCVEIDTGVCETGAAAGRDLDAPIRLLQRAAARVGKRLAWGGTHPFSH